MVDPYVMYNTDFNYSLLRDVLKETPYSHQVEEVSEATKVYVSYIICWMCVIKWLYFQNCDIKQAAVLLLAVYKAITMSYSSLKQTMDANVIL